MHASLLVLAALGAPGEHALYDPDPEHPWNRAQVVLFAREGPDGERHGLNEGFPLLWKSSRYLLEEERGRAALAVLRELVDTAEETAALGPRARLLMQGDLWALHDWAARDAGDGAPAHDALARAAARAMRALAPSADEVAELPDNLAAARASGELPVAPAAGATRAAFLPADLGAQGSDWLLVADADAPRAEPLATAHARAFGGRSSFAIYLHVPGGRAAALAFLAELAEHARPIPCAGGCSFGDEPEHAHLDPTAPPPPPGTVVALVQRLLAVDDAGTLVATRVAVDVQLRAFAAIPEDAPAPDALGEQPEPWPYQSFAELRLDRARFLAGGSGLVPVGADEPAFDLLGAHFDQVELLAGRPEGAARRARLASCTACHGIPGSLSIASFTRLVSGPGALLGTIVREEPRVLAPEDERAGERRAIRYQEARPEWAALRERWRAAR